MSVDQEKLKALNEALGKIVDECVFIRYNKYMKKIEQMFDI